MFLLGAMSTVLTLGIRTAIPYAVIAVVTGCAIASVSVVRRNEHVRPLLSTGWSPLLGAVVVSSASGRVLDAFVSRYEGYAMLAVAFGGMLLRLKAIYRVRTDIPLKVFREAQARYLCHVYRRRCTQLGRPSHPGPVPQVLVNLVRALSCLCCSSCPSPSRLPSSPSCASRRGSQRRSCSPYSLSSSSSPL